MKNIIPQEIHPTQSDLDFHGIYKISIIQEGTSEPYLKIMIKEKEKILAFLKKLKNESDSSR